MGEQAVSDQVLGMVSEKLELDKEEIKLEASFVEDLGADCLDVLELIMDLEDKFNLSISEDEARDIKTVGDAVKYIEDHRGE